MARQPTSSWARDSALDNDGSRGFALIELLCVLAIIGLLAAIMLPGLPRSTSRTKLEGFALPALGKPCFPNAGNLFGDLQAAFSTIAQ